MIKWIKKLFFAGVIAGVLGVLFIIGVLYYFSTQVPDFRKLSDYQPFLITKVYDDQGQVLAEYAKERRIYVPIDEVPQEVIQSFLAAEDTGFYDHSGFDPKAILRAVLVNVLTNRRQGASTITQQVAKTFLLSSEQTYTRKIKELILSYRIEKAFTKDEILELYLNRIYLGSGAYGIAAAAQTYFSKQLDELSIGERALIAGLPKAPSRYNPLQHPQRAKARRDVIIRRMEAENVITSEQADAEIAKAIELNPTSLVRGESAPHFTEWVRRQLLEAYGEKDLYRQGYHVYTSLNQRWQTAADEAVYQGLRSYDRRHGWRGPVINWQVLLGWPERLAEESKRLQDYAIIGELAVVLEVTSQTAKIGLTQERTGQIELAEITWARRYIDANKRGPQVKQVLDVLAVGDVIWVKPLKQEGFYSLEQIPNVQAALVAMDVHTGAVKAMVGGLGSGTGFNRASQAKRQVGSAFKPIVYAAAMEKKGMTPASIVLDAPVVFRSDNAAWKPHNYSSKVYGPSTLRRGLEQSRNLMTIRLARDVGMNGIIDLAYRLGLREPMENTDLAVALGSTSFSLLDITNAYGVFARQGKWMAPYGVERVQDATGLTLQQELMRCTACQQALGANKLEQPSFVETDEEEVINPQLAYQITSLLQGVVERGTGRRARALGKPVGGKTGTTNDYIDAWFVGYSPDVLVGVWVGFDDPATLGRGEAGSKAALPIWIDFMQTALANKAAKPFPIPAGMTFVRIDAETGKLPSLKTKRTLLEVFVEGTEPVVEEQRLLVPSGEKNVNQPVYGIY